MIFPWIFFFSEPEPFVGLAFFFVCTKQKGLEEMSMEQLAEWVSIISDFVWNNLLLWLLVGTGILFSVRTRFVQVRKLGEGFRNLFGVFSLRGK